MIRKIYAQPYVLANYKRPCPKRPETHIYKISDNVIKFFKFFFFYLKASHKRIGYFLSVRQIQFVENLKRLDHQRVRDSYTQPNFNGESHPQYLQSCQRFGFGHDKTYEIQTVVSGVVIRLVDHRIVQKTAVERHVCSAVNHFSQYTCVRSIY